MNQLRKFSLKKFFLKSLTAVVLFTITWNAAAQRIPGKEISSPLTKQDSTKPPVVNRVLSSADSARLASGDSSVLNVTDTFNIKLSKDSLEAPVNYYAEDSVVVQIRSKKILLYGKTKTEYQTVTLEAPKVEIDQQTQIMTAVNKRDSTGFITDEAKFADGEQNFTSDTIQYNFKTKRGLTKNTITSTAADGLFVHGKIVKKVDDNTTFVKQGYFTTCNLDEPHFGFMANKIKFINKKVAVSGPTHPEFEGVPIPVYIPFGYFPLNQGRHSGLLPPQFATNDQMGLGLEGLGYYKVFSDNWDAKLYGNIYSYGSWSANINPTYRKRYRYAGSMDFGILHTKRNFKGDPDFYSNNSFSLRWSHQADTKARPGITFGASVNASSTAYNRNIPNNVNLNFQNQLTSSITYSKTWIDKPLNLTLSANHNQNNQTGVMNVGLPTAGFSMATIYPFQKKELMGERKWYEQLGIAYQGNFVNQFSFYDTAFSFKQLKDTLQWGAQHSIPITLSLPPILNGAITVGPSVSYSQVWLSKRYHLNDYNPITQKVDTTVDKGFFVDQQVAFGLSFATNLFGTYRLKNGRALRHVVRPTIGFNYAPSLSKQYYDSVVVNAAGAKQKYGQLVGNFYGSGFSDITTGGISFGLDNNLEMKYRPKKDTTGEAKKLRLIDGFGFAGSYNFLAPHNKLSNINLYFRNNLFEKINLSTSFNMSPYFRDQFGGDSTAYLWSRNPVTGKRDFKLGRITSGSVSLSTSFQSKPKDPKKENQKQQQINQQLNDPVLQADRQRLLEYMRQNPAEFVDFNIPWQVSLSYSLNFYEARKPDFSGYQKELSSSASFNGSFSLTPKWNFSVNGYYDFKTMALQTFTMSIAREMHCWQMSINVTPVGPNHYFNFTISPKSGLLQDLRINRTRSFYQGY